MNLFLLLKLNIFFLYFLKNKNIIKKFENLMIKKIILLFYKIIK